MPMMADQGLNAKLLIEQGVGFEVPSLMCQVMKMALSTDMQLPRR